MIKGMVAALVLVAGPLGAQETNGAAEMMRQMGGGMSAKQLAAAIDKAAASPLGSAANPVRADMPQGQRAYLSRLRCTDGTAPAFARTGNVGTGVFGFIVDAYAVTCAGAEPVTVHMDMYHRHVETRAVPGFTMADGEGAPAVPVAPATSGAPTI